MTTVNPSPTLLHPPEVYPAKYFPASPTYNTWVKLSISDVHTLRTEPGFEGQNLYFCNNHPIKWVYLVASVVGIEDLGPRYALLTLDDGSGACIDVRIARNDPPSTSSSTGGRRPTVPGGITTSNTAIPNLRVETGLGVFELVVDNTAPLDIGTVIKAKCTISSFRSLRQLELKRINIIQNTNEEAANWAAIAKLRRDVLGKPWVLTARHRREIDEKSEEEERKRMQREREEKAKQRKYERHQEKYREKRDRYKQREERKRREVEMEMDEGALPGSDFLWRSG